MKILLILLCLLVSLHAKSANDSNERQRLCGDALGKEKQWFPLADTSLENYAKEFLRRTEMQDTPVVLCVTYLPGAALWNNIAYTPTAQVLVIGVGSRFIQVLRPHMRAIIAHEVAHVMLGDLGQCIARRGSRVLCEHDVDRIAMAWVGKHATLDALKESIRFLEEEGDNQPIAFDGVAGLKTRFELLELLKEEP